jgi:tetratricopeptide (TPR) repeat protein
MTPPLPSSAALAKKHFNAGLNAFKRNNLIEAEAQLAQAIAYDETQTEYWLKLGLVWAKMGRHTESIEANTMALALEPTSADALYNLGICHIKMEREQAGLDYLQQSYRISPNNTLAEQLADIFYAKKDFMTAAYYLLHLYTALKSATKEPTLHKLATSLYHNGDLENSLKITIKLMQLSPDTAQYKNLLLDLYRRVTHSNFDRDAQKILVNLLKDDNTKFLFLRNPWISLFLLDATYKPLESFVNGSTSGINIKELSQILENDFLCLGIRRGIAIGIPIENILTNIRKFFLLNWKDAGTWPPGLLKFIASLAVGCWYNDFVYFISPEEKECLQEFKGHVTALLHSPTKPDSDTSVLLASLLACYVPLYEFCEDETQLLTTPRTKKYIEPLLTAQLRAPKIERELIPTIPPFSKIVDETSLSVQNMYASRPYPAGSAQRCNPNTIQILLHRA